METSLRIFENNRNVFLRLIENFTLNQLNAIPTGFSNNIIWNLGHIIVTQQILVYQLSGLPMLVSNEMIEKYKNGSKPTGNTTQEEVDAIKNLLLTTVTKTKNDFNTPSFFQNYEGYVTKSTGFAINSANEALNFNNFHEGVHLGFLMNIRKFI
jgi:hypothetical protein